MELTYLAMFTHIPTYVVRLLSKRRIISLVHDDSSEEEEEEEDEPQQAEEPNPNRRFSESKYYSCHFSLHLLSTSHSISFPLLIHQFHLT
jgi:hypothetical protein